MIGDEEDPKGVADGIGQLEEVELVEQEVEVVDQDPAILLPAVDDLEHGDTLGLRQLADGALQLKWPHEESLNNNLCEESRK